MEFKLHNVKTAKNSTIDTITFVVNCYFTMKISLSKQQKWLVGKRVEFGSLKYHEKALDTKSFSFLVY